MITCPNKALPEWKELVNKVGENRALLLWNSSEGQVAYTLKSVNILNSDKAKQIFEKGKKANWDLNKILTELQVPKEQKQLILDKNITDREEIITSLLADNSFVVEINTAKQKSGEYDETDLGNFDPEYRQQNTSTGNENAKYYSNLTVPGGTNYTENEISTPAITPSIKGHPTFSTDSGIGWFRIDEKQNYTEQDIDTLIDNMIKSGVLQKNCS